MDILTHTFSGIAVASTIAGASTLSFKNKSALVLLGGFAGALPDIDALSLWSKFNGTFGKWLNLQNSGNEIYFSKLWYGHHAFMHSLLAAILIGAIITFILNSFIKRASNKLLATIYLTFICSFLSHLLGDLPTPASVWSGIALWWPSKTYVGGYGNIWWWNNYDIFLIIFSIGFLNGIYILFSHFLKNKRRWIPILIFVMGFSLVTLQIRTRSFDFSYSGHTPKYPMYEAKSKELQREILGNRLYEWMESFDNHLPFYF